MELNLFIAFFDFIKLFKKIPTKVHVVTANRFEIRKHIKIKTTPME